MFRNTYQKSLLTIFYSLGSKPLSLWDSKIFNGRLRRITDTDLKSLVLEIASANVTSTFIQCPVRETETLAIKLPFFIMILKNLKKYFTFEIQVLDDSNFLRRFRFSNFQTITKVNEFCTMIPLNLNESWNQIQLNLADLTKKVYNTNYIETARVKIHANIRIRRVYFTDYLYSEDELPAAYKIYKPKQSVGIKKPVTGCENRIPAPGAVDGVKEVASRVSIAKRVSFVAENGGEEETGGEKGCEPESDNEKDKKRKSNEDSIKKDPVAGESERRSSILKKSSIENDVNVREVLRASISFADNDDEEDGDGAKKPVDCAPVTVTTKPAGDDESFNDRYLTNSLSEMEDEDEEEDDEDTEDEYQFSLENFSNFEAYETIKFDDVKSLEDEANESNGSRSEIM